jgi:hypothetical protein
VAFSIFNLTWSVITTAVVAAVRAFNLPSFIKSPDLKVVIMRN